jgi:ketosteroid isomerase-like protein
MALLPAGSPLREEILALDRQRADAMVREDVGALERLLADDLSYTHSDGRTDTKESFLNLVSGPTIRYLGVDYSNQEVIDCGDAVIVRGIARMRLLREPEGPQDYRVHFLDVWARREGRWQMVGWQATRAK